MNSYGKTKAFHRRILLLSFVAQRHLAKPDNSKSLCCVWGGFYFLRLCIFIEPYFFSENRLYHSEPDVLVITSSTTYLVFLFINCRNIFVLVGVNILVNTSFLLFPLLGGILITLCWWGSSFETQWYVGSSDLLQFISGLFSPSVLVSDMVSFMDQVDLFKVIHIR